MPWKLKKNLKKTLLFAHAITAATSSTAIWVSQWSQRTIAIGCCIDSCNMTTTTLRASILRLTIEYEGEHPTKEIHIHTQTHTHTHKETERERNDIYPVASSRWLSTSYSTGSRCAAVRPSVFFNCVIVDWMASICSSRSDCSKQTNTNAMYSTRTCVLMAAMMMMMSTTSSEPERLSEQLGHYVIWFPNLSSPSQW